MCTDNKYQFTDFWANYNEDYLLFHVRNEIACLKLCYNMQHIQVGKSCYPLSLF